MYPVLSFVIVASREVAPKLRDKGQKFSEPFQMPAIFIKAKSLETLS